MSTNMAERPSRQAKKSLAFHQLLMKEEQRKKIKEVRKLLKKSKFDLTEEEARVLEEHSNIAQEIQSRKEKLLCLIERKKEVIDPPAVIEEKCHILAAALRSASFAVVYTGAGISTAANIPDYRGPEGIWTLLSEGKNIEVPDLSAAQPTFTHMAVHQLVKMGLFKHVVSQNCDGLHFRSGVPVKKLSEIHGNMFMEVCTKCKPPQQYFRQFDVTENTAFHRHNTGRQCKVCGSELKDTIVHFGEKGKIPWPLNWNGAAKASSNADIIVCLGSSLKVLKRYPCLWGQNRPLSKRPKLFIVNLQWTPKDTHCSLKINAKCDDVMKQLMTIFSIEVPAYNKELDPIFGVATPLTAEEKNTTTRRDIAIDSVPNSSDRSQSSERHTSGTSKQGTDDDEDEKQQNSVLSMDDCVDTEIPDIKGNQTIELKRTGWFGRGCTKLRKAKKKRLTM